VVSLGCPKNLIDTEDVLGNLDALLGGLEFSHEQDQADIILVNTCAFIEEAVSESLEAILELAAGKRPDQVLVVMGCLPLRYERELEDLLPEVDFFSFHLRPEASARALAEFLVQKDIRDNVPTPATGRRITSGRPWQQYVKISEGCSNRCTYCLIPEIRGRMQCRPPRDIVQEVNILSQAGAMEITLVAQDLTAYQWGRFDLASLLRLLLAETDVPWFRLMYLYPSGITPGLLDVLGDSRRICPYMDMPVQHASSRILKSMGRAYDMSMLNAIMERIGRVLPDIAMRTTVMVGFPGETEEDFSILCDFLERWRFHHLGCFVYSDEEDAPSFHLKDKVLPEIAKERKEEIMAMQVHISAERNAAVVGQTIDVLVDGFCEETDLLLCGKSRFQAPEVDGLTYINKGIAEPGQIVKVKITQSHTYDLVGEIN